MANSLRCSNSIFIFQMFQLRKLLRPFPLYTRWLIGKPIFSLYTEAYSSIIRKYFAYGPDILVETGFSLAHVLLKKYVYCTTCTPQYGQLQGTGRRVSFIYSAAGHRHERNLYDKVPLFHFE